MKDEILRRLELPFTRHLRQLLEQTIEDGHADEDFLALYLSLREREEVNR